MRMIFRLLAQDFVTSNKIHAISYLEGRSRLAKSERASYQLHSHHTQKIRLPRFYLRTRRIDVLFNNAGICAYGLAHELTEEEWDTMLDINVKGAWLVARRVIPVMIRQRSGVIINNSSIAGLRGMNRLCHYAASKWALTGLTKS
jgi:NAD(P)-dependent dehydrogenase (short-subunit alcohol dehydrogenase family)